MKFFILLTVISATFAFDGVKNLDFDAYKGTWYLIEIGPPLNQSNPLPCQEESYDRNSANNYIVDVNWRGGRGANQVEENAIAAMESPIGASKWSFYMSENLFRSTILATDYTSWAVEHTFSSLDGFGYERIMIRSRTRSIEPQVLSTLNAYVRGLGFDTNTFEMIDHNNCV